MSDKPFQEELAGLFATLFEKVFKKALDTKALSLLHTVTSEISKCILQSAEKTALVKCKKLNDAVKSAFDKMGQYVDEETEKLNKRMDEFEKTIKATHEVTKELVKEVKRNTDDLK